MIATIGTSGPSGPGQGGGGGGAGGGGGNAGGSGSMGMQQQQQQQQSSSSLYDRDPRHTQVKTYMDHGNGHSLRSTGGPTQYSKVGLSNNATLLFIINYCLFYSLS